MKDLACNSHVNGKYYLVSCPKCDMDNCSLAVADGICVWCGYNDNEKELAPVIKPNPDKPLVLEAEKCLV